MLKNFKSKLISFGIVSVFAAFPLYLTKPAQAQIEPDGVLDEYNYGTAPTLSYGSVGPAVEDVQLFLNEQGYYDGAIDGIYGYNTQEAVEEYQEEYGLASDGIFGSETWNESIGFEEEDDDFL